MPLSQRRITSADEMRALAHPLRLELLQLLGSEGPFTASQAARRLEETPANVSWHLRKLAEYGFVRQGQGPGRERPWKFVAQALTFGEDAEDPTTSTALTDLVLEREFAILRAGLRELANEPMVWRDATALVQTRFWLTTDEAAAIGEQLRTIFVNTELLERNQDPSLRPPGARLTALMGWLMPYGDPPQEQSAEGEQSAGSSDPEGITA